MAATSRCARCGTDNDAAFAFCHGCGHALPRPDRACAGCGARLDPSYRFCGYCGRPAAIADAGAAPPPHDAPPAAEARDVHGLATPVPGALRAVPRLAPGLRLVALRHDGQPGAIAPLGDGPLLCGRARGLLVFADDPTVSPEHARFTARAGGATVEDLGSVNGTFLRLKGPRALAPGDELRLGRQLLRLDPLPKRGAAHVTPWGSADPGYRARLVQLLDGGGVGEVFPLHLGENSVGREVGDVVFPGDRYVSARHARLDVSDAGVTVSDSGSSNGTFVRIAGPTPIAAGDQLLVGMQLIRVE